ncbi:hypothetical protein [Georgenia wangjunii]|uniref:hypothetical protein n=1 Tax=Georgenia wangjunii TaxID=3117730 RepID=UPI002F26A2C7
MLVATIAVAVLAAVLGAWAVVFAVRDRAVVLRQLILGGVVEAALVVQMVVMAVGQARGHAVEDPWTLWGYVVVALILLPVAAAWALAERTRWSSVVLLVAAFSIAVMEVRVWQEWVA